MPHAAPSDSAQQDLLVAAIRLFSIYGYAGASTRAIATEAGKPMSAITYHFGGKHGLYLAAAHHVAVEVNLVFKNARDNFAHLAVSAPDPKAAYAALREMQEAAISMLTRSEMEVYARFIVNEQADESEAFEIIYAELLNPLLSHVSMLLKMATCNHLSDTEAQLRANMLLGQLFMFRLCRQTILRTMKWHTIEEPEHDMILCSARAQLDAILDGINKEQVG